MVLQALRRDAITGLEIVGTAAAYYALAQPGLLQELGPNGQIRLLTPASGIAVAALVVLGWRVWPGILIGSIAVQASLDRPLLAIAGIAATSTLAALLAWLLLRKADFRPDLRRVRDLLALVVLGAVVTMSLSALLRTAIHVEAGLTPGGVFWSHALLTWMSSAAGVIVVTPFILLVCRAHLPRQVRPLRVLEGLTILAATGAVMYLANASLGRFLFLAFPLLIWAAWRFQLFGAAPCVLIVSAVTVYAAVHESGLFEQTNLTTTLLTVHAFVLSTALSTLFLAVAVAERNRARLEIENASGQIVDAMNRLDRRLSSDAPLIDTPERSSRRPRPIGAQPVYGTETGSPDRTTASDTTRAENAVWAVRSLRVARKTTRSADTVINERATTHLTAPHVDRHDLAGWCIRHLDAELVEELFSVGHLSRVVGVRLGDGRQVVVKVRPSADRLEGCAAVQRWLWEKGFPCPELLVEPVPFGAFTATAEILVTGGGALCDTSPATQLCAKALQRFHALAPSLGSIPTLEPTPPWAGWDHAQDGIWPRPDDRSVDLNAHAGPAWLDDVGSRVRARLRAASLPTVVTHVDWEMQNLRWSGDKLHVAHDWDSVAARPESTSVGLAAAVHTATGEPDTEATDDQVEEFIGAYEQARQRSFTTEERELAWAAGLWVRAYNAKKDSLDGPGPSLARLEAEAPRRLDLAAA